MPSPSSNGNGARQAEAHQARNFEQGDQVKGVVKAVNDFGVFLDVGASKEGFLPWNQVIGSGPNGGEILDLVVTTVDDKGRLTLAAPGGKGKGPTVGGKGKGANPTIGGFIHDAVLGVRPRKKGGKGDGRGAYTYPDGMPFSDFLPEDDVSGHITNIEQEGCWVDIGATKDAYLRWSNAPKLSTRRQVGDLVDDLKIQDVRGQEILLRWDDEGISSLTERKWEQLFIAGPCLPKPKEEDEGPVAGENCCALYGKAKAVPPKSAAKDRSADEELRQPPAPSAKSTTPAPTEPSTAPGAEPSAKESGKAVSWNDKGLSEACGNGYAGSAQGSSISGKGKGGARDDSTEFASKGNGLGWVSPDAGKAKGKAFGRVDTAVDKGMSWDAAKGTGKGPSPRAGAKGKGEGPAPAAGGGAQSAEARAKSAPPPSRQRLRPIEDVSIGEIVRGRVSGLSRAGAAVDFGCEAQGLVPRVLVTARCRKGEAIPRLKVTAVDVASGRVTLEPLEDE